jgi:hypothetical protein
LRPDQVEDYFESKFRLAREYLAKSTPNLKSARLLFSTCNSFILFKSFQQAAMTPRSRTGNVRSGIEAWWALLPYDLKEKWIRLFDEMKDVYTRAGLLETLPITLNSTQSVEIYLERISRAEIDAQIVIDHYHTLYNHWEEKWAQL